MELTVKIDMSKKAGRLLAEYLKTLSYVHVQEEKSPYDPAFVRKVIKAQSEKGGKLITSKNVWQSIK
jgi:hypothetical protein